FQAEDGIRDFHVTGVQTCALPICQDLVVLARRLEEPGEERLRRNISGAAPRGQSQRGVPGNQQRRRVAVRLGEAEVAADRPRRRSEERRVGKEVRSGWPREAEDE